MKHPTLFKVILPCLLVVIFTMDAMAQEQTTTIDTMTVTAQKREENVQNVPIAIDLFSDIKMEDFGLNDMADVVMHAPNVFMKSNTAESPIIIRGISSFKSAIFSPTGFYVDDVSFPLSYMTNLEFMDIQRVEILKGPQGTLYGRNTESGLVNVVTRKPDNQFRGRLNLTLGRYDSDNGGGRATLGCSLAGPIQEDRFFMGLAFQGLESDGFREDLETGDEKTSEERHSAGRGVLRFTPNSNLDISLSAGINSKKDGFGVYRLVNGPDATDAHTIRSGDPDLTKEEEGNNQNLKISYQGVGWDLVSITSRQVYDIDFTSDMDFNGGPMYSLFGFEDTQWSQEVRISSQKDKSLTWLAGLYGFKEQTETLLDIRFRTPKNSMGLWNPVGTIDMTGYALFSQLTWHLLERWHVTGGLRYDHQELEGKVVNNQTRMMPFLPTSQTFYDELTYDELLPKLTLSHDLTKTASFYLSAAKGYQVGGYNYAMVISSDTFTYDPEYVWNYEFGIKSSWFENSLLANLSFFYLKMADKQVYEQVTGSNPGTTIDNAAKAHTRGMEIEITARPVRGLEIFSGLGIISGEYDDWVATEWNSTYTGYVKTDYSGKKLPNVPEYTFNLGMQYRFLNGFFLRGDVNGVGNFYGDHGNTVKEKAYALVNLKTGYETKKFDIYLWGKNVFDKHYHTIKYDWDGEELVQDGAPLSIGLTFNWRF